MEDKSKRIEENLSQVEASEDVTILYACESGSRAWGFASFRRAPPTAPTQPLDELFRAELRRVYG